MQPWFSKIFFLWQLRKTALNYPQKTLFMLHGSFKRMFMIEEFLECSMESGLLSPNPGRKKQHAQWRKKCDFFKVSYFYLKYPIHQIFGTFYCGDIFFKHNEPSTSQSVHRQRKNYFCRNALLLSHCAAVGPYFFVSVCDSSWLSVWLSVCSSKQCQFYYFYFFFAYS